MSRRLFFLTSLLAVVVLAAGGALLATSHSGGTSPAPSASSVTAPPDAPNDSPPLEPVGTCPAGCRVTLSQCPHSGVHSTCPDGAACTCCVHSPTDITCVRN